MARARGRRIDNSIWEEYSGGEAPEFSDVPYDEEESGGTASRFGDAMETYRRGKRRRRLTALAVLLALLGAASFGAYYFVTAYRVDPARVYVEGNRHYSDQEIAELVMDGPLGDNSKVLSLKYNQKTITDVPFVDAITVSVLSDDSIRITVFEKALAGYVRYLDHYIYFDKDGTVVESSNVLTLGVPQVTGLAFSGVELGKPLTEDGDATLFARTLDLTKLIEKYDLTVSRIHFHEDGKVTLYFGDTRVDLGDETTYLEDKIMLLPVFFEKAEGLSGVLDMENYNTAGLYVLKQD